MNKHQKSTDQLKVPFSILAKFLVGIIAPLIVILLFAAFLLNRSISNVVSTLNANYIASQSGQAAQQVQSFFQEYIGISETASASKELQQLIKNWDRATFHNSVLQHEAIEILSNIQKQQPDVMVDTWILNYDSKETIISTGTYITPKDIDPSTREWYTMVTQSQQTIVTGAYDDATNGTMMVTMASPVFIDNQLRGIFGIDISLDYLTDMLSKVKIGESGYVAIYDNDKNCLYHPDESLLLKNVSERNYAKELVNAIQNNQEVENVLTEVDGQTLYITTVYLPHIGYTVLGTMPESEFIFHIERVTWLIILCFVFCLIILISITAMFAFRTTQIIKDLSDVASDIAKGDLDIEVHTTTNDELGLLSNAIRAIVARLKIYILYIQEVTAALHDIGNGNFDFQLKQDYVGEFSQIKEALLLTKQTMSDALIAVVNVANEVNHGSQQISMGAQTQAEGATEQASSVQELAATLSEITKQVDENTSHIEQVNTEMQVVLNAVHEGNTQMGEMLTAMDDISNDSTEVRTIIKQIEDIAFQTNILALNAAVEAARAGSAGKGFAVVADEVRNLATKTAAASQSTNQLIERALETVQRGKIIADQTARSIGQVNSGINKVAERTEQIAKNSQNQNLSIRQTAQGVEQISSVVQTSSATAEQSAAASQELSAQAQILHNLVAKFHFGHKKSDS